MKQTHAVSKWILGVVLCTALTVWAADKIRFEGRPGSKVKIDGTSTVHDWSVESQLLSGFMEFDAAFDKDPPAAAKSAKAEVTIMVRSLKSGKKPMDTIMHEALKMPEHPKIEYKLIELTPKSASVQDGKGQFEAKGSLTVAGVTRTNTMPVTIEKVGDTRAKVSGATNVKMTDFGIKPPSPSVALGLIKTGDDVKITFEWQTEQAVASKTAEAAK